MTRTPSPARLPFVDFLRGLAVLGAISDHALLKLGVLDLMSVEWKIFSSIFFRACTPVFFLLFGMMLEMIYVRKLETEGIRPVMTRLLRRSLLCYLGYAVVVLAIEIHVGSWEQALMELLLLGTSGTADILKFYALVLLCSTSLLILRSRYGPKFLLTAIFVIWSVTPFLEWVKWPDVFSPFSHLTGLLFGRPAGLSYYSVHHGLSVVMGGMLLGWTTTQFPYSNLQKFRIACAAGMAACAIVVALAAVPYDLPTLASGFQGGKFRRMHHPLYYASFVFVALGFLMAFSQWNSGKKDSKLWHPVATFGRSSLLVFTLGNFLLVFLPSPFDQTWGKGLVAYGSYLVVLWIGTEYSGRIWKTLRQQPRLRRFRPSFRNLGPAMLFSAWGNSRPSEDAPAASPSRRP